MAVAQAGYRVVANFAHNATAAAETVQAISRQGGFACAMQANVAVTADRAAMLTQMEQQFGRLDLLVNNAGITSPNRLDLLESTEENWDTVLGVNLKGPFFLSQLAAKLMLSAMAKGLSTRGTIVNISSISAYAISTNRGDYCIAKAGLRMMTQLFAARLAEERIRVYEVCPGVIRSDMTAPVAEKYDRLIADGLSPIKRWGEPSDVAAAVVALAADNFPFSTGDCLNVDGGFHIRRL
jgi:NAD(P)-dependent dehydrogenase (short-subunit alcohol dehydrogenase family)